MQGFPSREEEEALEKAKRDELEEKLTALTKSIVKLSGLPVYGRTLQKVQEEYNQLIRAFYHQKIEDMEKDMRKVKDILNEVLKKN